MSVKAAAVDELFDCYFQVRYSHFHAKTKEEIERYGIRVSGIDSYDATMEKQMVDSFMTINMMFEQYRRGLTIRVVNYADTAKIYEIIQKHLATWRTHLSSSMNVCDETFILDLIELDKFASTVYSKAVSIFTDEETKQLLNPNVPFAQRINMFNILKKRPGEITSVKRGQMGEEIMTISGNENQAKLRDRTTYQDSFTEHLSRIKGWRGGGNG